MTENNKQTVLAFDTSGLTGAAGVMADGKVISSAFSNSGLTHSKTLLPAIEKVLYEAQTDMKNIDTPRCLSPFQGNLFPCTASTF